MKYHRAYKTKLRLNNRERRTLLGCAGAARLVYNWALADRIAQYEAGTPTTMYRQKKRFNNEVKDKLYPWLREEYPYTLMESAFRNLKDAYDRYFAAKEDGRVARRIASMKARGKWESWVARRLRQGYRGYQIDPGFPRFKSKRRARKSFTVRNVVIERGRIRLPRLGWFRLEEKGYLPEGHYVGNAVTISERAGQWYVSIQVEVEKPEPSGHQGIIGIDLGSKTLAVCSDGREFENPRALRRYEKKRARLGRELARRTPGGQNWLKTKAKIARLDAKVANIRRHAQHNASRQITAGSLPATIVIEDLNVEGMKHNRNLSKSIADAGMSELARQIQYKAAWNGIEVIQASMWFPSSKTCSNCGCVRDEQTLDERTFVCPDCGYVIDRDLNAAINLAAYGERVTNAELLAELESVDSTAKQEVGMNP